ncbi:MAG: hypothetical protein LLF81_04915 [Porphyromonadaceae bacterium]|nr:hypothetical protein [Porphyromonadaceae bacterium]
MTGSTGEKYIRDNYQNATVQCYDDIMDAIAANREPMCFISDNKIVGLDCDPTPAEQ